MLIHKFDKLYSKDYLLLILAKLRILFLAWYDMGIIIDYTGALSILGLDTLTVCIV